jgi:hypothetical protein
MIQFSVTRCIYIAIVVSQSSELCRHNPLCCFSTSNTKGKRIFRYRLSPETSGYILVRFYGMALNQAQGQVYHYFAYIRIKSRHICML